MNRRFPLFSFAIAAAVVGLQLLPGASEALQFERAAVMAEPRRWWTAHLTHFGWNHLTWDLAVWLVLGCFCERISRARMIAVTLLSGVAITTAVWLWQPQFQTYRGLSGIDFALFGLFVGSLIERRERGTLIVGLIALVAAGAKCAFELATAATLFASGDGYAPVPLAHAVGLVIGAAPGLLAWSRGTLGSFSRVQAAREQMPQPHGDEAGDERTERVGARAQPGALTGELEGLQAE
jgi:rhomboid family GlyGly-CTERM serine protease